MKKAHDLNINTRRYWNDVYGDDEKRAAYAQAGTCHAHGAGAQTTARFTKTLEFIRPEDRVIDIGCGVGELTTLVKDTYPLAEVWGVDISDTVIAANGKARPDIEYRARRVGALDGIPEAYFDVVFAGETLEHLDDPADLFRDAHRLLKPGGMFILTTPREDAIQSPEHTWFFTQADIDQLYTDCGFARPQFVYLPDMEHLLVIMAAGRKA